MDHSFSVSMFDVVVQWVPYIREAYRSNYWVSTFVVTASQSWLLLCFFANWVKPLWNHQVTMCQFLDNEGNSFSFNPREEFVRV